MTKQIVVLGGGTGGTLTANRLRVTSTLPLGIDEKQLGHVLGVVATSATTHNKTSEAIAAAFPGSAPGGAVDRGLLRAAALGQPGGMRVLERILHPMVRREQAAFLARARRAGRRAAVLDIPLLLETGGERRVDLVVVVTAPLAVQLHRVRRRRGMSLAETRAIIARQMPDRNKRRRADVVIRTGLSRHHALRRLRRLLLELLA